MKFAMLALVGGASALTAYGDPVDCVAATTSTNSDRCWGKDGATVKAVDGTNGQQAWCAKLTRGQAAQTGGDLTAKLASIVSGDFGGTYDTIANAGKAVWTVTAITKADGLGSSCAYTGAGDGAKCVTASTGPLTAAATVGTGYQLWSNAAPSATIPVKLDITAAGAAPLYGALLCSQARDVCDVGDAWGNAKLKDFTAATTAPVDVKLGALDDRTACSYVVRAKCEAPFMQANPGVAADEGKVTWTILEYSAAPAQGTIGATLANSINTATAPAQTTGFVKAVDLSLFPIESATAGNNAQPHTGTDKGAVGQQGLQNKAWPKVSHVRWKGDQGGAVPVESYLLFEAIAAKKAEYAAYSTAKAAYDTKRVDYDTKLDAAQVILDAQKKDIFKAWFPSEADKKAIADVPKSPIKEKPALPSAYSGPVAVFNHGTATDQAPGLINTATAAATAPW